MFSLSQMTKVKLVCALAWRENFAKGNNSVTDTKRRMHDSPTLRQSTSWTSDGEGHVRWQRIILLSERSMVNEECQSTRKGTMQLEVQDWRAGKEIRNIRLQAVLLGSNMRFDKRKEIKEKKLEEGQVSLSCLTEW